jgi:hypothetical protein
MAGLEDRVERLTQTLERMLDQGSFSGGARSGTGGASSGANPYQGITNFSTQFVNSAGGLVQGTGDLKSVIGDVTKVIGAFGPVGDMLGRITESVSDNLMQMNRNMMESSKFGMNFGQNLGLFTQELALAGIGQKQWVTMLQNNSKYLGGSAESAQAAATMFVNTSQKLVKEGAVIQARLAGIDLSEFQDQLLMSTNMLKFNSLSSDATQKLLKDSVISTTLEIDNMARITGKSRQEIQKGVDAQMRTNTMQIAMLSMSADELTRYQKTAVTMNQYGQPLANLFAEMSANKGNVVSKEGNQTVAAVNLISAGAGDLLRRISTETNEERRKQLTDEFRFRMAEATNDKEKMRLLQARAEQGDPVLKEAIATFVQGQNLISGDNRLMEVGGGTMEGYLAQRADADAKRKKELSPLTEGATPGNQVSVAIQAAEAAVKSISAGLAQGTKDLIDVAGKELYEAQMSNVYLKAFAIEKYSPAAVENMFKEAVNYSGKDTSGTKPGLKPNELVQQLPYNTANPLPVTGTVRIDPTAIPGKATGSKDVTGSWFENFGLGSLNMLHGKEAVVPEGKMAEFINDMVAQSPGMLAGLQGSLRNAASENNSASIQRALEQFTSAINVPSTISPVSNTNSMANAGTIVETKSTSDLLASIEKLNTKMDKLITAVEDGSNANVKAVKSRGNLIA